MQILQVTQLYRHDYYDITSDIMNHILTSINACDFLVCISYDEDEACNFYIKASCVVTLPTYDDCRASTSIVMECLWFTTYHIMMMKITFAAHQKMKKFKSFFPYFLRNWSQYTLAKDVSDACKQCRKWFTDQLTAYVSNHQIIPELWERKSFQRTDEF